MQRVPACVVEAGLRLLQSRPVERASAWVLTLASVPLRVDATCCTDRAQAPPPPSASQQRELLRAAAGAKGAAAAPLQLLELALQALIYSEAANLRHTPHVLFLLFHVLRSSTPFQQVCLLGRQAGSRQAGD